MKGGDGRIRDIPHTRINDRASGNLVCHVYEFLGGKEEGVVALQSQRTGRGLDRDDLINVLFF